MLAEYVPVVLNSFPTVNLFLQQISIKAEIAKEDICVPNWGPLAA
jgi:hypothetical protein